MSKFLFEIKIGNSVNNQQQNIPGIFGHMEEDAFISDMLEAGEIVTPLFLTEAEGYTSHGVLNGNTHHFVASADGSEALTTGLFVFNNYDVASVQGGDNRYHVGANTIGLGLPENARGTFAKFVPNEHYAFGEDNFVSDPTGFRYAVVVNKRLSPQNAVPYSPGGYFEIVASRPVNEGGAFYGTEFICVYRIKRDYAVLSAISVTNLPDKVDYNSGESLALEGVKISAIYNDGSQRDVSSSCLFSPADGTRLIDAGIQSVSVSYTEGETIKTTSFDVTVYAVPVRLFVAVPPTKTEYEVGEALDLDGITVVAEFTDTMQGDVTENCVFSPESGTDLTETGTVTIDISYTFRGETVQTSTTVTVS